MGSEERGDFINSQERATSVDPDRTLTRPNFDEDSIHRARPAVSLAPPAAPPGGGRSWSASLVALAIAAGIVGGLAGIFALNFYQKRRDAPPPPAAALRSPADTKTQNATAAAPPSASSTDTRASDASATERDGARASAVATPEAATRRAASTGEAARAAGGDAPGDLRAALGEWLAATNARDIDRQMNFYDARMGAYYLARNASHAAVRAEKEGLFARASTVDVRADDPQITVSPGGETATMRFRKQYTIEGGGHVRRGAVIQELRWRRTPAGWKITSERDVRIVN